VELESGREMHNAADNHDTKQESAGVSRSISMRGRKIQNLFDFKLRIQSKCYDSGTPIDMYRRDSRKQIPFFFSFSFVSFFRRRYSGFVC
jgi:hypothetical protein